MFVNTFGIAFIFIAVIILALILAFEIWMFIDALLNKKITNEARALWVGGMLLVHPFIAIVYYFTARRNSK